MWYDALAAFLGAWAGVGSVAGIGAWVALRKLGTGRKAALVVPAVTPDIDVAQVSKDVLEALSKLDLH